MAIDPLTAWPSTHRSAFTTPMGRPSDGGTSGNLEALLGWGLLAREQRGVVPDAEEEVVVAGEVVKLPHLVWPEDADTVVAGLRSVTNHIEELGAMAAGITSATYFPSSVTYNSLVMPDFAALVSALSERRKRCHVVPEITGGPDLAPTVDDVSISQRPLKVYEFEMPAALAHLEAPIRASRTMLELKDNWDGDGSPRYDEETWNRAVDFVVETARGYWKNHGITAPAPRIGKGPEGSIDIHWLSPNRELLINIPPTAAESATFYGEDADDQASVLEGRMHQLERDPWILEWLTK